MGNKQSNNEPLKFYVDPKDTAAKKGKAREVPYDISPQTYTLPNFKKDPNKLYLKIVSWNLNMEANSSYTPKDWETKNNKWELVYNQTQKQDPDIITFQELSIALPYFNIQKMLNHEKIPIHPLIRKYIDSDKWIYTHTKSSHCGHVIILVHKRLERKNISVDWAEKYPDSNGRWPGVVLYQKVKSTKKEGNGNEEEKEEKEEKKWILCMFGVHLAPFGGKHNAEKRRLQFDALYKEAEKKGIEKYFMLIGDTNMRFNEEEKILNDYGNKLSSCWTIVDEKVMKNSMFTWYRNYFEVGAKGVSRYDKIFMGEKLECCEISVFDQAVSDDKFHFLSDHRAISTVIQVS